MAYFSNGSEGGAWTAANCEVCWHDRNEDCPIWALHLDYNYAQCGKTSKAKLLKAILSSLVPMDGLFAGPCRLKATVDIVGQLKLLDAQQEGGG